MKNTFFLFVVLILTSVNVTSQRLISEITLGNDLPFFKSDVFIETRNGEYISSGRIYHYEFAGPLTLQDSVSHVIALFDKNGKTLNYFEFNKTTLGAITIEPLKNTIHYLVENSDGSIDFINELVLYNLSKDFSTLTTKQDFKNSELNYKSANSITRNNQLIIFGNALTENLESGSYVLVFDLLSNNITEDNFNISFDQLLALDYFADNSTIQISPNSIAKFDVNDQILWQIDLNENHTISDVTVNDMDEIFTVGHEVTGDEFFGVIHKFDSDGNVMGQTTFNKNPIYDESIFDVKAKVQLTNIAIVEDQKLLVTGEENSEWLHAYRIAAKLNSALVLDWDYRIGDFNITTYNYSSVSF